METTRVINKGFYEFGPNRYRWDEYSSDLWLVYRDDVCLGEITGSGGHGGTRAHYAVHPAGHSAADTEWADWKTAIEYLIRMSD